MNKITSLILKLRWLIIVTVIVITGILGYFIKDITINSDVINSLPDDDPHATLIKKVGEEFGGNKMGMVILECQNIFTPDVILHVRQITDSLKVIPGISSVTSLTSIIDIKGGEEGLEIGMLIDEYNLPESNAELSALKERVFAKDMYRGAIVSEDETATIIIFSLQEDADIRSVAIEVKEKTTSLNLPEKLYYAGSPMMVTSISSLIASDLVRLIPIAFLLIAIVLYAGFHSLRGVILPLLTSGIAVIWVIGIMAVGGFAMSMVTNNIPIILLAVGSAYTIHVLNRINLEKNQGKNEAIIRAMKYIYIPVILAALTTMIGFVSFIFGSYLTMILQFGIFTALGTLFTVILALVFVPAMEAVLPWKTKSDPKQLQEAKRSYLTEYFLHPLQNLLQKHPKNILVVWATLLIVSIGGILMIQRNVDIKNYFKEGNPTRTADEIMTEKFGGTKPIFVLFKGDIQSPDVLNMMLRMEETMKESPDIVTTQSVGDLIVEINDALGEGRSIPDDQEKIEQLWFLLDGSDIMNRFVTNDLQEGIIISKFVSQDNKSKRKFAEEMDRFIRENSTEECTIEITGMPFIDLSMDRSLIRSQLGSLSIALLFVILVVGIVLRSIPTGIYASVPIIASIVILFGVMGYTGIPLNMATVLVASIALGIGIDYSIHVITHYNHSRKHGDPVAQALASTILISGKAIVINVTSVSAGFLVLLFSEMVPLQYFGLLISLSMIGSGLGALTLLPVILILSSRKKRYVPL